MSANVKIGSNTYYGIESVVLNNETSGTTTFTIPNTPSVEPLYKVGEDVKLGNAIVKVTGNHVKIEFTAASTSYLINLRQLVGSTNDMTITNQSKWFTIPVATCTLAITNVTNANSLSYAMNFKLAGSTTSTSDFGTGQHADAQDISKVVTNASAIDVGCLFVSVTSPTVGAVLEFDVSFTVDGTRYI